MEHIENAILCLENILPTVQGNIDAEEAIKQLCSATRLLGSSTLSSNISARLSGSFRGQVLLLYRQSISLALDYIAAIFQFIHHKEASLPRSTTKQPSSWETLLVSIFSGLLDFLEENPTDKTRERIALVLYPIVCPLYFISIPGNSLPCHGELLSTVYQTLTATIDSHPRNTTKLRDNQISRKSLGVTISETKDFLALESLLDLFGSLIPSLKGGRTKRTVFIKDVFDPVIFKDTGKEVHKLLEDISNPDWSFTSVKIVKLLAQNDISFPQPFETVDFMLNDSTLSSTSFYVDKSQFLANIDKAGGIETLCIPFTIVSHIASSSKDDQVHIVLQLAKPPMLGNKVVPMPLKEDISVSWNMNKSYLHGLSAALRSRQLSLGKPMRDKLSKVKPIELDFSSNKDDSHVLTNDRIQKLSQSWALTTSPTSSSKIDEQLEIETSPLVPKPLQTAANNIKPKNVSSASLGLGKSAALPSPSWLDLNGNLPVVHKTTTNKEKASNVGAVTPSTFDDKQALPAKSKRRRLIISDDEEEEEAIHQVKSKIMESSKRDEHEYAVTPPRSKHVAQSRSARIMDRKAQGDIDSDHDQRHSMELDVTASSPHERINGHKRERAVDVVPDHDKNGQRPTKRGRREQDTSTIPSSPKRKVYSRKGRHAAPIVIPPPSINFDEILVAKPTRASAMKAKNGNVAPKPQKISGKKQDNQVQHNNVHIKTIDRKRVISSPAHDCYGLHDTAIKCLPTNIGNTGDTSSRVRRSERVAKSTIAPNKTNKTHATNQQSLKPQKAPWEEPTFQTKELGHAIKFEDTEDVSLLQNARSNANILTDHAIVHDDASLPATSEKSSASSLGKRPSHASKPKPSNDVETEEVMIYLTRNEFPIHPPAAEIKSSKKHAASTVPVFPEVPKEDPSAHAKQLANITNKTAFFDASSPITQSSIKRCKVKEEAPSPFVIDNSPQSRVTKEANRRVPIRDTDPMTPVHERDNQNEHHQAITFVLPDVKSLRSISNKMLLPVAKNPPPQDRTVLNVNRYQPLYSGVTDKQPLHPSNMKRRTIIKEDPLQKIVSVIQQINEVVIHSIANRFERVDEDLSDSQRILLQDTVKGLQEMYHESVQYFNDMVDLEENYSARCTALSAGLYDNTKSSEQLAQRFKDIALDHSRQSLSKKLPSTLFQKLPDFIAKPSLQQ